MNRVQRIIDELRGMLYTPPLQLKEVSMYSQMTKKALQGEWKRRGLKGYSRLPKAKLVAVLEGKKLASDSISWGTSGELSPKEVDLGSQITDPGTGNVLVPHPGQIYKGGKMVKKSNGTFVAPKGYGIVAQKGDEKRSFVGRTVSANLKEAMAKDGWEFTAVFQALSDGDDVVLDKKAGTVVVRKNGRTYAPQGYRIKAKKDGLVQTFASCQEKSWKDHGWALSLYEL